MTQTELQRNTMGRAREFADRRGYKGGGFELCDYQKALSELSPQERLAERGLTVRKSESQKVLASKHFSEEVVKRRASGLSHAAAVEKTKAEEPPNLRARRAGFEPRSGLSEGQAAMCTFFRADSPPAEAYAAGSGAAETTEGSARTVGRDVLVRQVAASVLHRGNSAPDQYERSFADDWYGVRVPPPPPVSGGQDLGPYNRQRAAFVESVLADARQLLADPAERATLAPRPLGG